MSDCVGKILTARKLHYCGFTYCRRPILPGEDYVRLAIFDGGTANTYKLCTHCYRVCDRMSDPWDDWDDDIIAERLEDAHPVVWSQLQAGWRTPEGEILPLPIQERCLQCGQLTVEGYHWCPECDQARIERLTREFLGIMEAFGDGQN